MEIQNGLNSMRALTLISLLLLSFYGFLIRKILESAPYFAYNEMQNFNCQRLRNYPPFPSAFPTKMLPFLSGSRIKSPSLREKVDIYISW